MLYEIADRYRLHAPRIGSGFIDLELTPKSWTPIQPFWGQFIMGLADF